MSFKKFLEETNNAKNFTKEQKLVLLIGKELEESNFKLKSNNDQNIFQNFKEKEGKFSYDFIKDNYIYNLIVQNKKDGKFEITLSNDKRTITEEIQLDIYLKDSDSSLLSNYIKDRIKNIEIIPLIHTESNDFFKKDPNINRIEINDNFNNNDFFPKQNNDIGIGFANIGYKDLHGDLPNFIPGYNDYFGRPNGNLMGPEVFNPSSSGGIRYDPITPFGPRFDFIPQYDGPMKKNTDPRGDIDIGIPKWQTGNGFNNFGGGYNPFI